MQKEISQPEQRKTVDSITKKLIVVGIIFLISLGAAYIVRPLIDERAGRQESVEYEISQAWGSDRHIVAPHIFIPFLGEPSRGLIIYPEQLTIDGIMDTTEKKRTLYKVPVYNASLIIAANFKGQENLASEYKTQLDPSQARLRLLTPEQTTQSTQTEIVLTFSDIQTGIFTEHTFNLKGAKTLAFHPVATDNIVNLTGNWDDISFQGSVLPSKQKITDGNFSATWNSARIDNITETFTWPVIYKSGEFRNPEDTLLNFEPGFTPGGSIITGSQSYGINLLDGLDIYDKNRRSIKYAALFIAITFLTYFVFETVNKIRIHPVQYLLVGFGLVIFFLLLLSLSEHIGFANAYLVASLANLGLLSWYTNSFAGTGTKKGITIGVLLAIMYGYLFFVINQQDYALLAGSLLLFIALASAMYATRKVNWFNKP